MGIVNIYVDKVFSVAKSGGMERADFYIYCYFRPDTGEPCYIGKGRGARWKQHLYKSTNIHLRRIIAKAGKEIPYVKLHINLTEDQANAYEIALIKAIKREPDGPLVNLTDGGEGLSGHIHSDESRKKMSASHYGKKRPLGTGSKIAAALYGRKHSPEARVKIALFRRGKKMSSETIAKIVVATRGRKQSPDHIEKRIAPLRGRKGRKHTPEHIAKVRSALRRSHRQKHPPATGDLFAQYRAPATGDLFAQRPSNPPREVDNPHHFGYDVASPG